MKTAMESIKDMVDVNTVVGDPVETHDGTVIIPVSRVTFGFGAGGAELAGQTDPDEGAGNPFGGGSGAGVSVQPVGFLVVGQGQIRMLPVEGSSLIDRLLDLAPSLIASFTGRGQDEAGEDGDGRGAHIPTSSEDGYRR